MTDYYIQREGDVYGPLSPKELRQSAKDGRVLPDDDLSSSPDGPWHEAKSIASLFTDEALRAYRESKKQAQNEAEYDYSDMLDSAPDVFQAAPEPEFENEPDEDQPEDDLMSAVHEEKHAPIEPPPLKSSTNLTRKPKLTKCPDCLEKISKRAKRCPHCGFGSEESLTRNSLQIGEILIGSFGVIMVWFFALFYDTTNGSVHNIGLLNNRLCGLLIGLALITWALISSKR